MRRGLIMQNRDWQMLLELVDGPATTEYLFEEFFSKENGNNETRSRIFRRRIQKIADANLISYKSIQPVHQIIVTLTALGANLVADKYYIEVANIRAGFPNVTHIRHDLVVAQTIRKLRKESKNQKKYVIDYIHVEKYLRKMNAKKGVAYPDYELKITNVENNKSMLLGVEIVQVPDKFAFIKKIKGIQNLLLVVLPRKDLVNTFCGFIYDISVDKQILHTSINAFLINNLLDMPVLEYPSGQLLCLNDFF